MIKNTVEMTEINVKNTGLIKIFVYGIMTGTIIGFLARLVLML